MNSRLTALELVIVGALVPLAARAATGIEHAILVEEQICLLEVPVEDALAV